MYVCMLREPEITSFHKKKKTELRKQSIALLVSIVITFVDLLLCCSVTLPVWLLLLLL